MKKIILATLISFLTACTLPLTQKTEAPVEEVPAPQQPAKPVLDRTHFIGDWQCEMDGGKVGTSNKVKLSEDGHTTYLGTLKMPKDEPLLQYTIKRTGTWAFADNVLSYAFTKSSVERAHTYEMLRKIKTSKELNASENEYFATLKQQMSKSDLKPVKLAVSNFNEKSFNIQQQVNDTVRKGHCQRPTK